MKSKKADKQPFHFRMEMSNYDYLCSLAIRERRSVNACLNVLLEILRQQNIKNLEEIGRNSGTQKNKSRS